MTRPGLWREGGLLVATLVAAGGLVDVAAGGFGGPATTPCLVTALVGFLVPATLLRSRPLRDLALPAGVVVVLALSFAWAVQRAGRWPPPLHLTWTVPLPDRPAAVLLCALAAGLAAVAGRALLAWPAAALLPSLALLAVAGAAQPGFGSAVVAGVYVLAVAVVLGGRQLAAAAAGLLAAAVALAVGLPLVTGTGAGAGSPGAAGASVTALSLADDVVGVEVADARSVQFTSATTTYWQVATLTTWTGSAWVPDAATRTAITGASATPTGRPLRTAPSTRHFGASVTVAAYRGRLLPVPPTTEAVRGIDAAVVPGVGVVAASSPGTGATYTATATLATGSPRPPPAAQLAPYLALPAVPATVTALAQSVTATAPTPLGRAEALVDWFRSGLFRYTLTPPAAPAGTDPLVYFLTTGRAGTCQSFAGAFAVMARSLGLPTRVAVGFTAGRSDGRGTMVVTGADAHAWPEVYLDGSWVSFEPTPARPSGSAAPEGVIGPTGVATTVPSSPTTPTTAAPTTVPATTAPPTTVPPAAAPAAGTAWLVGLLAGLGALLVVGGTAGLLARRRRRRAVTPAARVLAAYHRAERSLRRARLGRRPGDGPTAHARALVAAAVALRREDLVTAFGGLRALAVLAERAGYDARPITPAEATSAERTARRLAHLLRRPSVRYLVRSGQLQPQPQVPTEH